ncbi:MAG TPA: DUF2934 domain-containing protein [Verrucomicrobiae bacterium]|nr:DUF2934 domain-containing protein [Verrucomicrobiae bacterium]
MSDYNEVSKRAYELWENAGKPDGKDSEFWFQAEREVHQGSNGSEKQATGRALQSPRGARPIAGRAQ